MSHKTTPPARQQKLRFVLCDAPAVYGAKPSCDTPEKIYDFYQKFIKNDSTFEAAKEHVYVVLLDTRLNAIGYNLISVGTVFEAAGDPSPSRADENVTKRLVEAAKLLQIQFLDHVVCGLPSVGRTGYYSFREAGLIP